jgi:Kef-type K+ transport system membrane component KefB
MARHAKFTKVESLTLGIGMVGRAEMAFILAAIGLKLGAIPDAIFSILVFATFLLNILASIGLKAAAVLLKKEKNKNLKKAPFPGKPKFDSPVIQQDSVIL